VCHSAGTSNRTAVVALSSEIERKCKDAFYMLRKYQEATQGRMKKMEDEMEKIKINCKCGSGVIVGKV
jgi:predicted translin family RNA/ssDNA-binding protein